MPASTLKQFIGSVQRATDYSLYHTCPDSRVAEFTVQELDVVYNDLNITGRPWNFQSFPITAVQGEDFHQITEAGDFTVPFIVETMDSSNPSHRTRAVTIMDIVSLEAFAAGQQAPAGLKWPAIGCAFTEMPGQPGQRAVRFAPKANASGGQYMIYYTQNVIRPQSLQDAVIKFPQWETFLHACVVVRCLPYCEWEHLSDEAIVAKRSALLGNTQTPGTYASQVDKLGIQFMRMRRKDQTRGVFRTRPFGMVLRGRTR